MGVGAEAGRDPGGRGDLDGPARGAVHPVRRRAVVGVPGALRAIRWLGGGQSDVYEGRCAGAAAVARGGNDGSGLPHATRAGHSMPPEAAAAHGRNGRGRGGCNGGGAGGTRVLPRLDAAGDSPCVKPLLSRRPGRQPYKPTRASGAWQVQPTRASGAWRVRAFTFIAYWRVVHTTLGTGREHRPNRRMAG